MADFECDASEMRKLVKDLGVVDKESRKAFYGSIEAAGEIVATRAREKANAFTRKGGGTDRIASSVRVRRRGTSVKIELGGPDAPEGAPIEHHGIGGTFRHRVFGQDVWVNQPAHPSLIPAAHETEALVVATVDAATFQAFTRLGF